MTSRRPTSIPGRAQAVLDRLPIGTVELGRRYLVAAERQLARLDQARPVDHRSEAVEAHLVRPLLLVDDWPDPTDPLPVGDGAVHADLIDDDLDALARLRATIEGRPDPEHLARQAQAWRLPVTPYRSRPPTLPTLPTVPTLPTLAATDAAGLPASSSAAHSRRALDGCLVVDLTALWAGPLATMLLADQGIRVVKVDPKPRPDAFAEHTKLYQHLNGGKDIIDLDLREPEHRRRFEALLGQADLLVDSFSRRVMPNLGYDRGELKRINPKLSTLSIVAFPQASPEADWLSYGPGVHAASGLAASLDERPTYRSAPIAYPDALAGLNAFGVAVNALAGGGGTSQEVSLASSIEPLLSYEPRSDTVGGS